MRMFRLALILLAGALALSGCFQQAGVGMEATPLGEVPIVPVTPTVPLPTQALPTFEPPTAEVVGEQGLPTQPPVVFNTPVVQDGSGGALIADTPALPTAIVSDAALTATALIAQARAQSGVEPTQPPVVVLVATSTPFEAVPLQAGEMTATAMIVAATEAAYARETATATALGILPPTATLGPTPTYNPMLASQDCVHVVQRGQNVYRIALSYGVTIADIARANGLANSAVVRIGQELVIPGCGDLTPTPGVPAAVGGEAPPLAEACQQTHLIQPGENLYRIALRYGITMNELRNANGISNINVIKAGDNLVIPCR